MKKCPFCAEDILDEAIKCRHCGSDLNKNQIETTKSSQHQRIVKVYTKGAFGGAVSGIFARESIERKLFADGYRVFQEEEIKESDAGNTCCVLFLFLIVVVTFGFLLSPPVGVILFVALIYPVIIMGKTKKIKVTYEN